MRHQHAGRKFNRDTTARKALLRSLARALVLEGHVVTTAAKGKTLRSVADRLVTVAKGEDQLHARRELQEFFGKRDVANVLVDRIVPLNTDRNSGYTTLSVLGNRAGDNAQMVEVKWVVMPDHVGSLKNPNPAPKNERKRSTAPKTAKKKPVAEKTTQEKPTKATPVKQTKTAPKPKAKASSQDKKTTTKATKKSST